MSTRPWQPTPSIAPQREGWLGIAGPTASGKSALAMTLADLWATQGLRTEIISVDSALVYRGMDIGTAKPSASEQQAVPHHLIDIRDPLQAYSAAEFVTDAKRLIAEVQARGALPLLVGGTMLYFKALLDGMDNLPPADPAVRAALESRGKAQGWPALHAELAQVDPVTAARLSPNDSQRIQRALEVYQLSGQPLSSLHTNPDRATHPDTHANAPGAGTLISLEPVDRAWLHQRIAERFEAMLETGFLDEVARLRSRGDLHADLPAMRSVGYRQAWEMLDGAYGANPALAMATLRERGMAATRQLAKRQITWLRSMPQRQVVICDAADPFPDALRYAQDFMIRHHAARAAVSPLFTS